MKEEKCQYEHLTDDETLRIRATMLVLTIFAFVAGGLGGAMFMRYSQMTSAPCQNTSNNIISQTVSTPSAIPTPVPMPLVKNFKDGNAFVQVKSVVFDKDYNYYICSNDPYTDRSDYDFVIPITMTKNGLVISHSDDYADNPSEYNKTQKIWNKTSSKFSKKCENGGMIKLTRLPTGKN